MEIQPFKFGDADNLDLQDIDDWVLGEIPNMRQWEGYAFTILDDCGLPIGISGFACENGTGTGWLIGSRQLRDHPVYLHRTMKRVLRELLRHPDVTRIQIDVEKRSDNAVRWLERLGFRRMSENASIARYTLIEDV